MNGTLVNREWFRSDTAILLGLAVASMAIHLAFINEYGYFRDELYYIACSKHLSWGYVDQPPLSIFLLAFTRWLFGDSLLAIRIPAAIAGSAMVFIAGRMARQLGGGRGAQVIAALATLTSPVILGNAGRYFSMNAFDLFFWAIAGSIAIEIFRANRPRLWILFGAVAGLGLMNKYSMGFFVLGLIVGMLLTPERIHFRRPWFWLGTAAGACIFFPHLLWEFRNGFPTLEFMDNATALKNIPTSPWAFFLGQITEAGPTNAIVWIPGLIFLLMSKNMRPYRLFGFMYVVIFVILAFQNAKAYYLSPILTLLFAAGGCAIEAVGAGSFAWIRPAVGALVVFGGIIAAPFTLPVLPVNTFIQYQNSLGIPPLRDERTPLGPLPQYYADMFGWQEMVDTVARIYGELSPHDREQCWIYTRNYGEAGAIDFFGRSRGLPGATCTHNSYWFWKPDRWSGEVAIMFGRSNDTADASPDLRRFFDSIELAGFTHGNLAMPYETGRPIYICRGARFTLEWLWQRDKHFI